VFVVQISKHSGTGYVLSIAEARVHNRISPCRICGGQSDTATGFSPSTLVLPCQYHSAKAPHLVKYRRSYIILATDSVLRQYALLFLTHTHTHTLSLSLQQVQLCLHHQGIPRIYYRENFKLPSQFVLHYIEPLNTYSCIVCTTNKTTTDLVSKSKNHVSMSRSCL